MRIAMTGASGNMGREALKQTIGLKDVEWIRVLLLDKKKNRQYARHLSKLYGDKVQTVFGSVAEDAACAALVKMRIISYTWRQSYPRNRTQVRRTVIFVTRSVRKRS